ncbi:MAG: lipoyl domain-containing protein [Candidatus Omnitrophica bacterium]|nr:lipoyl domain-containing protein [Candidatus Omnitrophota bacterium]
MFWFKKVGQKVKSGDELLEVQTDKAIMDIESPATGTIKKILFDAGKTLRPGEKVGEIQVL